MPRRPAGPARGEGDGDRPPAELQAMNALGPLAKGLAFLMGKQPEEERHPAASWAWSGPRSRDPGSGRSAVRITRVLDGLARRQGRPQAGDRLVRVRGRVDRRPQGRPRRPWPRCRPAIPSSWWSAAAASGEGQGRRRADTDGHRRGGPLSHAHDVTPAARLGFGLAVPDPGPADRGRIAGLEPGPGGRRCPGRRRQGRARPRRPRPAQSCRSRCSPRTTCWSGP